MISDKTKSVIQRAKALYAEHLQRQLESDHAGRFVAIEPDSGDYFVADTFDEAVKLAKRNTPRAYRTPSASASPPRFTSG